MHNVHHQFAHVMLSAHDQLQTEALPSIPEGSDFGTAPSQHSAPAMPSEPPVTSPHRQLPGAGVGAGEAAPSQQPPSTDPANGWAKENQVHNFFR